MSLTPPDTLSPGYLVIVYTSPGHVHRSSMRLVTGCNMEDTDALNTVAESWQAALIQVLPTSHTVTGWELHDPDHVRLYERPFTDSLAGVHDDAPNGPSAPYSRTLAYTGRGVGPSVFTQTGQWVTRIFVGVAFSWSGGSKFIAYDTDAGTSALWAFFDGCLVGPADFYGQHVELRLLLPVQHNGFAENHWGE